MNHKTVLFVAALPAELNSIKKEVKKLSLTFLSAKFFLSWVGNYKTLYNLKHYLDNAKEKPDFIINIWLCWRSKTAQTDIFQVYRILWAANWRELLSPIYVDFRKKYSILSSEKVITWQDQMLWEDYVDMESYAIDYIATEEKIPYIILKKPFDIVSNTSKKIDISQFQDCLSDIEYQDLLKTIQKFLEKNHDVERQKKDTYLGETLKYFQFTFSEKEIWKKWYAKLIANKWSYKSFLKENTDIDKKDFLNKLTK